MSDELRIMLFATVIKYCKGQGMTERQVCELFSKKNIKGGYKILSERTNSSK